MKRICTYLFSTLLLVGLICSCSSSPEYGKMIPKNAYFVMALDLEEAVESSELGDVPALKNYMDKSLKQARLPQGARDQLREIMDNPQKTGFDFREPVFVFASDSFPGKGGLLGAVSDQDDLEDFLQIMVKEGVCTPVLETEGVRYTTFDKAFLAFNQEWFFCMVKSEQQTETDALAEIRKLAAQPVENSMQSDESFREMTEREGFMHLYYVGTGLKDIAKELDLPEKDLNAMLPSGIQMDDFALMCDIVIKKGEIQTVYEMLSLTDAAEDFLGNSEIYGDLNGNLVNYIPADAIYYGLTNIQGSGIFNLLKTSPLYMEVMNQDSVIGKNIETVLTAVDGDVAFYVGTENGTPEFSFYAETENTDWLKLLENSEDETIHKIDDRTYSVDVLDSRHRAYDQAQGISSTPVALGTVVIGAKKGISYVLYGSSQKMLEQVEHPVSVHKGCNAYTRLDLGNLMQMDFVKKELGPLSILPLMKITSLFDYAELYVEDGRKGTFRLVMQNKDQSPVKTLYDEVEKILQIFG